MHRVDVLEILEKMPAEDLSKTILALRGGGGVTLDAVARTEDDYLIVRGREAGTNDEGRGFFIPYEEILFVKLDRMVSVYEVKTMYGEKLAAPTSVFDAPAADGKPTDAKSVTAQTPAPAQDPAAIAKQNLLARIRAARSIASTAG
jgi:hypothetical protein